MVVDKPIEIATTLCVCTARHEVNWREQPGGLFPLFPRLSGGSNGGVWRMRVCLTHSLLPWTCVFLFFLFFSLAQFTMVYGRHIFPLRDVVLSQLHLLFHYALRSTRTWVHDLIECDLIAYRHDTMQLNVILFVDSSCLLS